MLSNIPLARRLYVLCSCYGYRRITTSRRLSHNAGQQSHQLGTSIKRVADAFCNSMLRDRVDGNCFKQIRPCSVWSRSLSIQSQASRLADCCRKSFHQNDASASTDLYTNDRTKVGDLHGCVCFDGWGVRYLCGDSGNRPISASGCLRSGLPPKTGDAHRRCHGDPTNNRRRQDSVRRRWFSQTIDIGSDRTSTKNRCDDQRFITFHSAAQSATRYSGVY